MAFGGLDHVGFTVSDMDRSVAFYTDFLGHGPFARTLYERPYLDRIVGYAGVRLDVACFAIDDGPVLELLQYLEPAPGGVDMETYNVGNGHMCLVTRDLRADFERLRGRVEFRDPEPVRIEFGAYEGALACYLRDPDGITIELVQPPS